jgi:hypothetical protein
MQNRDADNIKISLKIEPLYCNATVTDTSKCLAAGEKVTVYTKLRDTFKFKISSSLTVSGIIFDAIDSTLLSFNKTDYSFYDETCLRSRS